MHTQQQPDGVTTSATLPGGTDDAHIAVRDLVVRYGSVMGVGSVSFTVRLGEQLNPAEGLERPCASKRNRHRDLVHAD